MRAFFLALLLISLSFAAIPSWIQPGLQVQYDMFSSGLQNGQPVNAVQAEVTMSITTVSQTHVTGTATATGFGFNYNNPLNTDGNHGMGDAWQFWVDPANPQPRGTNGELLTFVGSGPYTYGGRTWDATMYSYNNPQTHVEYRVTFETRTGLVIAYAEKYPTQQIYAYFKSINRDLSDYNPSAPVPGGGGTLPCLPTTLVLGAASMLAVFKRRSNTG